jgi:hypothetical protein
VGGAYGAGGDGSALGADFYSAGPGHLPGVWGDYLGMLYWANCNPGWLVLLVSPLSGGDFVSPGPACMACVESWMGAIAWFTLPWRWFSTVVATAVNLISGKLGDVFWGLLQDYQKDRLILFLDPDKDPLGGGYHLIQSRIAIGAGKLWGQGVGNGSKPSSISSLNNTPTLFFLPLVKNGALSGPWW